MPDGWWCVPSNCFPSIRNSCGNICQMKSSGYTTRVPLEEGVVIVGYTICCGGVGMNL